MPKCIDLTGQRFGKLTVLERTENIGTSAGWRCRCDCGKETVVRTASLRSGGTKSCGCLLFLNIPSPTRADRTCVEAIRARTIYDNNTSGVRGVSWNSKENYWASYINFKGKRHYLGTYRNFEDAVAARKKAEAEMYDTFLEEYDAAQAVQQKEAIECRESAST